MVVEFVGMPGSGKSTIAHAAAGLLRADGHEVSEPTWTIDRLPSANDRRLSKLRVAAIEGLSRPGSTLAGAGAVLATSQSNPAGYPSGIVNWTYLAGLYRNAARHPGITLFDQGVLQAIWSVVYGSESRRGLAVESWVTLARERLTAESLAVFVEADDATIRSRLARRSESRSRLGASMARSEAEAERAIARGRDALDYVERVASQLEQAGRLRITRLDSGTGNRETQARAVVSQMRPCPNTVL
jgi:energy-coupling factor transporter ATP-binding protein EcfA2